MTEQDNRVSNGAVSRRSFLGQTSAALRSSSVDTSRVVSPTVPRPLSPVVDLLHKAATQLEAPS